MCQSAAPLAESWPPGPTKSCPVTPRNEAVSGSCGGGATAHDLTALFMLRRPPLDVFPERLDTASTLATIACFNAAVFRNGQSVAVSNAAPATWGVAMEVPPRLV